MNVFDTHEKIIADYASYIRSFINIADPAISKKVHSALSEGKLWPDPLLQFNPAYEQAGSVKELAQSGLLHHAMSDIFKGYSLYRHQLEAIRLGVAGKDFVVTSGTGSGKSLTYIGSIFDRLLTEPPADGVAAIVVYPMNALINSQSNEFNIYKQNYEDATRQIFPITVGQYTGQEKSGPRAEMQENPPQILLTNYMMLELLLTRLQERKIRDAIYSNLRFLVFDELHTYRRPAGRRRRHTDPAHSRAVQTGSGLYRHVRHHGFGRHSRSSARRGRQSRYNDVRQALHRLPNRH
jgi:ATP-dependent helicase YprA (DUF1998 family)